MSLLGKTRYIGNLNDIKKEYYSSKQASLDATLVQNYDSPTHRLDGVECRTTSVANKNSERL